MLDWEDAYADDHADFAPFDHAPEPRAAREPELHEPPPPRASAMPEESPTQHMPLPDHDVEDEFEPPSEAAVPRPHPAAPAPNGEPPGAGFPPVSSILAERRLSTRSRANS